MTHPNKLGFVYVQILNLHIEFALINGLENAGLERFSRAADCAGIKLLLSRMINNLQKGFQLRLRRLLDPAKTRQNENLSLANILDDIDSDSRKNELRNRLADLSEQAQPVVNAVNKITAHNDAATIQNNEPLGKMPGDAYERLIDGLYDWIKRAGMPDPYGSGTVGDAPMNIETLRKIHWDDYRTMGETQAENLLQILTGNHRD